MNDRPILMGTDTISGVAPEILDSIILASKIKTLPYGNDIFTKECKEDCDSQIKKWSWV